MLIRKDFCEICLQLANNGRGFKGAVEVVVGLSRSCICYLFQMIFKDFVIIRVNK